MAESLDSVLGKALAVSGVHSGRDAIVVALHSVLLSEGFVCVAVGDEDFGGDSTRSLPAVSTPDSPQLPPEWNASQDVYALQYRHEGSRQMCLVKVISLGGQLLLNAISSNRSEEIHSTTLDLSKFVKESSTEEFKSQSVFTNLLQLITTLNKEIVSKLEKSVSSVATRGSTSSRRDQEGPSPFTGDDPLRVGPPRHPRAPIRDPYPLAEPGPFGIGDGDRLPFGVGGGGMIFDPLRGGGRLGGGGLGPMGPFPPSHPPGARFDPVAPFGPRHPPGRNPRGGGSYDPDPDHLPPPGYDDMFS